MSALTFPPEANGAVFASLLSEPRLAPLGPGTPNRAVHTQLAGLTLARAFAGQTIVDEDMAKACLAGVWLYHDFLDESHAISQEIRTPTGSYWHAIMHRREPDAENSKYWWRRVGEHPVFDQIKPEIARRLIAVPMQESWLVTKPWDAAAFVDLCERSTDEASPTHELCVRVQQIEWELLFAWCYDHAVGKC